MHDEDCGYILLLQGLKCLINTGLSFVAPGEINLKKSVYMAVGLAYSVVVFFFAAKCVEAHVLLSKMADKLSFAS